MLCLFFINTSIYWLLCTAVNFSDVTLFTIAPFCKLIIINIFFLFFYSLWPNRGPNQSAAEIHCTRWLWWHPLWLRHIRSIRWLTGWWNVQAQGWDDQFRGGGGGRAEDGRLHPVGAHGPPMLCGQGEIFGGPGRTRPGDSGAPSTRGCCQGSQVLSDSRLQDEEYSVVH